MSLKDALQAAGVEIPPAVQVNVLNEHAVRLLTEVMKTKPPSRIHVDINGYGSVEITFFDADDIKSPHTIVLDRRGTWHVNTTVKI